jgi:hypothetical protein
MMRMTTPVLVITLPGRRLLLAPGPIPEPAVALTAPNPLVIAPVAVNGTPPREAVVGAKFHPGQVKRVEIMSVTAVRQAVTVRMIAAAVRALALQMHIMTIPVDMPVVFLNVRTAVTIIRKAVRMVVMIQAAVIAVTISVIQAKATRIAP